ncbi:MAG: hypothetical protein RL023_843 [Candidatus Parcubacteria bacterium]|jgi:hypothetical protein
MSNKTTQLKALEELLSKIESDVKRARMFINQLSAEGGDEAMLSSHTDFKQMSAGMGTGNEGNVQVVEGVFDGYFMIGADTKKYPVPLNYSSKTKLIPGDVLKLRVMEDGKLVYKLISQANRRYVKCTLTKTDDNKFTALSDDGKAYMLNQAAVSYYKANVGDEMSIITNADGIGDFAAIEAVIPAGITAN